MTPLLAAQALIYAQEWPIWTALINLGIARMMMTTMMMIIFVCFTRWGHTGYIIQGGWIVLLYSVIWGKDDPNRPHNCVLGYVDISWRYSTNAILKKSTHYPYSRTWTRPVNTGSVDRRLFTARVEKTLSCNAFFNTATSVKYVDREHGPWTWVSFLGDRVHGPVNTGSVYPALSVNAP